MTSKAAKRRFPGRILAGCLLVLAAAPASAVKVTLDGVSAMTSGGEVRLAVDSRASFDFDPQKYVLTSVGSFSAMYGLGPSQALRFSHKLENFSAARDGRIAVKSYECVEGTLGGQISANYCGNYRFGPNAIDDGGLADDVVVGPRKSLDPYRVSALTWDGESLLLIMSADGEVEPAVFPEYSLELRFSAVKPTARSGAPQTPAR